MRKTSPSERSEVLRRLYGQEGDLPAFFALYDELLHKGSDFVVNVDSNSVQPLTNEEVMVAVDLLRENSSSTNDEFSQRLQESLGSQRSESEIGRLVNLAVQAMIMVDCSAKTWHSADYSIGGYKPISWLRKETFLEFVDRSFQVDPDPVANEKVEVAFEEKAALKAWKLRKRLGVRFRGTNNLSEHLVFDQRSNSLYLFHHAGFLKAQLEKARDQGHPLDQSMADSLQRYVTCRHHSSILANANPHNQGNVTAATSRGNTAFPPVYPLPLHRPEIGPDSRRVDGKSAWVLRSRVRRVRGLQDLPGAARRLQICVLGRAYCPFA